MSARTLGILELENETLKHPGGLSVPGTFQFPVRCLTVPGASVRAVVGGDQSVKEAYIHGARRLESEGVAAIIANCGFSSLFQAEVAAAVSIPVALSSLLLVPLVAKMLPPGRRVGVLTYDAGKLTENHFAAAGWSPKDIEVSIAGIEGSETWRELAKEAPDLALPVLVRDVLTATKVLLKRDPAIATLVFECAGFPIAAEAVRRETGLPVADYVGMAKMLVEMSSPCGRR